MSDIKENLDSEISIAEKGIEEMIEQVEKDVKILKESKTFGKKMLVAHGLKKSSAELYENLIVLSALFYVKGDDN